MPKKKLEGADKERVKTAQEAYEQLLDEFYENYRKMLALQQYKAAKDDTDYLRPLIAGVPR